MSALRPFQTYEPDCPPALIGNWKKVRLRPLAAVRRPARECLLRAQQDTRLMSETGKVRVVDIETHCLREIMDTIDTALRIKEAEK